MTKAEDPYSDWSRAQLRKRLANLEETHQLLTRKHQKMVDEKAELQEEVERLRKRLDWIAYDRYPDMSPQEAAKDALDGGGGPDA